MMMTGLSPIPSLQMVAALLLLLLLLLPMASPTDPLNPYDNPTIGANLEHYDVDRTANTTSLFTCADGGARCVFRRSHFTSRSFGQGQQSDVDGEGAVWAATVAGAVLTLGNCNATAEFGDAARGACVVSCNANCTCLTYDNDNDDNDNNSTTSDVGQPCTTVSTRAPTPAPRDSPTTTQTETCPKQQFTEFCGDLMHGPGMPSGIEQNYDCYNFCGGVWVSSCDFSGQCGTTTCDNSTATGTMNGEVQGCTYQDFVDYQTMGGAAAAGSPSSGGAAVMMLPFAGSILVMIMIM